MQTFRIRRAVQESDDGFIVRISEAEAQAMGLQAGDQVELGFEPDAATLERIPARGLRRF